MGKTDTFSIEEIKMLYGLRWGIETSFRELKHVLGAKNFHAKEREYIEMEIWARLILYNFCSIITAHVVIEQKDKSQKHPVLDQSFVTSWLLMRLRTVK